MASLICRLEIALARSSRAGSRVRAFLSAANRRVAPRSRLSSVTSSRDRTRTTRFVSSPRRNKLSARSRAATDSLGVPRTKQTPSRTRRFAGSASRQVARRARSHSAFSTARLHLIWIWRCRSVEEPLTACTTGRYRHPSPTARRGVSISARTSTCLRASSVNRRMRSASTCRSREPRPRPRSSRRRMSPSSPPVSRLASGSSSRRQFPQIGG